MNKQIIITALLAIVSMEVMAQTDSTTVKKDSTIWSQTTPNVIRLNY